MKRIGLKLCGNCNPDFMVKDVLKIIEKLSEVQFVSINMEGIEKTLYLNSCISACNGKSSNGVTAIIVKGLTFQGKRFNDVYELAERIAETL